MYATPDVSTAVAPGPVASLLQRPEPLPYVDTVPGWLGPTLMLFGVSALVLWGISRLLPRIPLLRDDAQRTLLLFLVVLGTTFTTAGALGTTETVGVYALGLFAAGRFVEGGAAVRGMRKLAYIARNRSFPGGRGKLVAKVRYAAIRAFVGVVVAAAFYGTLLSSDVRSPPLFALTLVWTLGTLTLAVVGLSWKLESADDELPAPLVVGLLATFAGATVYDYVHLAADVTHILVGAGAFLAGIVVGIVAVLTG